MSVADALAQAGAKPAGKRPYFLDPQVERVLAITMAVAQELAVTRQRVDSLERILQAKAMLDEGAIDNFAPAKRPPQNEQFGFRSILRASFVSFSRRTRRQVVLTRWHRKTSAKNWSAKAERLRTDQKSDRTMDRWRSSDGR